jgi:hypothetical protein
VIVDIGRTVDLIVDIGRTVDLIVDIGRTVDCHCINFLFLI